jgi:phosphoenolpyruvate carboxylase
MQQPLMNDIERLSGYLGEIIKRENPKVYDLYERYRAHALRREHSDDQEALQNMIQCSLKITPDDAFGVVRAFTQTLNLINSAEVHHRMRLLRNADIVTGQYSPLPMREDSVAGTMSVLIDRAAQDNTATPEQRKKEIFDVLLKQKVDIVLTAHPTEVNRRTLLRKYREISETLAVLDRKDLSPYEKAQAEEALRREICSIW